MWDKIEAASRENAGEILDTLISGLRAGDDPHFLFDALLLKWKFDRDLSLLQPTTIADVPAELKSDFEAAYMDAARQTGSKLLETGRIADAWMYFRAINDPSPVTAAIEQYVPPAEMNDELEEMLQLALYQRINPAKGVSLMLATHGMCNTVTALDQLYLEISPADRTRCAQLMVDQLYEDLVQNVRYEVSQKTPLLPPDLSLAELITGRLWLFENDNYHIDVSHLNAVVRFARALEAEQAESITRAIQLAMYGAALAPHLQYPGEPPFDAYYEAHQHYFRIVSGEQREESLEFFRERLRTADDQQDRELIAYVMVDLLMRIKDYAAAIAVAEEYLHSVHEQSGFSFVTLCQDTGDLAALARHARRTNNPVLYVAACLQESTP